MTIKHSRRTLRFVTNSLTDKFSPCLVPLSGITWLQRQFHLQEAELCLQFFSGPPEGRRRSLPCLSWNRSSQPETPCQNSGVVAMKAGRNPVLPRTAQGWIPESIGLGAIASTGNHTNGTASNSVPPIEFRREPRNGRAGSLPSVPVPTAAQHLLVCSYIISNQRIVMLRSAQHGRADRWRTRP